MRGDVTTMKAGMKAEPAVRNGISPLALSLAATLALGLFCFLPRVNGNSRMLGAFLGAVAALLVMWFLLRRSVVHGGRRLSYEFVINTVHWVQPLAQGAVYVYWGMYWPEVYRFAPLILAQFVFAYALDMLVCWSRRDKWVLGFGPLPIIMSTNLFLWFKDDWFFLQFAMVATGVLGKEFLRWQRDGRSVHIFNPSAFSLFVFSIGLIVTNSTPISWGQEIATTITRPDHIYLEIFLVGLVVQALFSVTLVTLSAAAALFAIGLIYTRITGVYNFVDSNIPASVFLGLHLLVTDPATSPRSTPAKVVFGALYGAGVFSMYIFLAAVGAPRFYDKLLCVPALNLSVRALDRASNALTGRFRLFQQIAAWKPRPANFAYMGIWISLFTVMMTTGFLAKGNDHPGGNTEFWHNACDAGRLYGCREWLHTLNVSCAGAVPMSCLSLGEVQEEGRITPRSILDAGKSYARACDLNLPDGCRKLAQVVSGGGQQEFQKACDGDDSVSCFILGWLADKGLGMEPDPVRAVGLFKKSCSLGWARGCGLMGECYRQGEGVGKDPVLAKVNYDKACKGGHAPSCLNEAIMLRLGLGGPKDDVQAEAHRKRACDLGAPGACIPGESPGTGSVASEEASGRSGT